MAWARVILLINTFSTRRFTGWSMIQPELTLLLVLVLLQTQLSLTRCPYPGMAAQSALLLLGQTADALE